MSKAYTVKQVAQALGFSTNTVYKYLDQGKIKATRLGTEGRFRIPEAELERLLQLRGGQIQIDPSKDLSETDITPIEYGIKSEFLNNISTPNLFDWLVAILAIFVGITYFLLPSYVLDVSFLPYAEYSKYIKIGLIGFGLALIGADIFKAERRFWHAILHLILAGLFAGLAFISYKTGYYPRTLGMAAVSFILLTTAYFKVNERVRFVIFVDILILFAGLIFLNYPQTIGFKPLSDWISKNQLLFAILWYTIIPLIILASIFSLLRQSKVWETIFAVGVSTGLFTYAFFNLPTGLWVDTVYSIVLGSFALIFPFWRQFNWFARSSQKGLILSFGWVVAVFLIGIILTFYLQVTFKDFVKSQSRKNVQTASKQVESYLNDSEKVVASFATNKELIKLMLAQENDASAFDELVKDFYLGSATLRRVFLIDKDGRGLAIYPADKNFIGVDLSFRNYFQQVKNLKKMVISEAVEPVVPGVPVAVAVAAPILGKDGNFLGIIAGSLDFVKLGGKLSEIDSSPYKTFIMADGNKKIVLSRDLEKLLMDSPQESALSMAVEGKQGQVESYDESGVLLLQSFTPIKSLGWGMSLNQPLGEVLKGQSVVVFLVFLVTIISGIGSLLAVIYLRRS